SSSSSRSAKQLKFWELARCQSCLTSAPWFLSFAPPRRLSRRPTPAPSSGTTTCCNCWATRISRRTASRATRGHPAQQQSSLTLSITVSVLFSDFNVIMLRKSANQVAEKLRLGSVSISKPTFIATVQRREAARREASLLAVANAKSKAGDIARYFNCTLLKPFRIIDEGCNEGAEAAALPAAAGSAQPPGRRS
uniref:Alba domain-containing protein n=1 Tax=Macrostomum lignano TaxID=282301 RepID=A0A1I8F729_9PLAT